MPEPAVDIIVQELYRNWDWETAEQGLPIEHGNDEWPGAETVARLALQALRDAGYEVVRLYQQGSQWWLETERR